MDCDDFYNIDCKKVINFLEKKTVFKKNFTFNKKKPKKGFTLLLQLMFGEMQLIYLGLAKICKKKYKINRGCQ